MSSTDSSTHQAVESTVINFCRDALNVTLAPQDISVAHRLRAGPKDNVRPIIVRFTNRRKKDEIYRAKKSLKHHANIFISEQLTKSASSLFFEARKLLRGKMINSTWTQNGQVFVKFTNDPTVKPTLVKCMSDLNLAHSSTA